MQEPFWLTAAKREIGAKELPENRGPVIRRYVALAKCGAEGEPWCAIFVNAMLECSGIAGSGSAMARSFEHNENFIRLAGPALGCIVTFWRGIQNQGLGHVGFYVGEQGKYIFTLGGNEGDMVKVEGLNAHGSTFGLSGFYWPKAVRLPTVGKFRPQIASAEGNGKVT